MKRWQKISLAVIGLIVVLILVVPFFIPTEKIKNMAVAKIQARTDYPVSMGDVSVRIFPRLGVSLRDIAVGDAQYPIALSVDELFVQVQWLPLLSDQIKVDELRLEMPTVTLREESQKQDAQLWVADPEQETPAQTQETDTSWAFSISNIVMRDGKVVMLDAAQQPSVELADIEQNLSLTINGDVIQTSGKTSIGQFSYAQQNIEDVRVELTQQATWNGQTQTLDLGASRLQVADIQLNLSGQASQVNPTTWRTDMVMRTDETNTQDVFRFLPLESLQGQGIDASGVFSLDAVIKGDWDTEDLEKSFLQSSSSLNLVLKDGRLKDRKNNVEVAPISLQMEATPENIHVSNFALKAKNSSLQGHAMVKNYLRAPKLDGNVSGTLALKDFEPLLKSQDLSSLDGKVTLDIKAKNASQQYAEADLVGNVVLSNVEIQSSALPTGRASMDGKITLSPKDTMLITMKATTGQSDILIDQAKLPSVLTWSEPNQPFQFAFNAQSDRLDLQPFVPSQQEEESDEPFVMPDMFYQLQGSVDIRAKEILWDGLTLTNALVNAKIANGVIDFQPLQMTVFEGRNTLNGRVDFTDRNAGPSFDLALDINKIRASQALAYADNIQKLLHLDPSMLDAQVSVQGKSKAGLTPTFDLNTSSLDANGKVSLHQATLAGHPVQNAVAKLLDSPSIKKLKIEDRVQKFRVDGGRVYIDKFDFQAGSFGFVIDGWQSIDGSQNLDVQAQLPPSMESKLKSIVPSTLVAALKQNNQLILPLQVKGQVSSPSVVVDDQALGNAAKEVVKDQAKEKLEQAAAPFKDKAEDKIKEILPKKDSGSQKDVEKQIKDKTEDVKKSIKGLF
jgi:uncharacterized protein involved in outer membrane biogenesis